MIKALYKSLLSERKRNNILFLFYKIRGLLYFGNNYYCNCCNTSFRKLLDYGNTTRKNVLCPSCHSLERTRVLLYFLQKETSIFKEDIKILHFAPEHSIEKIIKKRKQKNYITADINPNLADEVIDITSIPYQRNTFDIVICSHVLGHVPDECKAIDEIYRVLKPDGKAIIMTVIDPTLDVTYEDSRIQSSIDKLHHYGESDLVRKHGKDFVCRLAREHIKIDTIDYRLSFDKHKQIKYSLGNGNREVIFLCHKTVNA